MWIIENHATDVSICYETNRVCHEVTVHDKYINNRIYWNVNMSFRSVLEEGILSVVKKVTDWGFECSFYLIDKRVNNSLVFSV